MKKTLLFSALLFLLSSCALSAQLVHQKRFLTENWYLSGNKVSSNEVRLHLEKTNQPAYRYFKGGQNADWWNLGFSLVSLVGSGWVLGNTAADSPNFPTGGYVLMLGGLTGSIICSTIRNQKFERAVETYNLGLAPPPTRK